MIRAAFLLLLLLLAASAAPAKADPLVLGPLRGWHPVRVSPRAELGRTAVQAAAARKGRLRLRSEAFVFARAGAAARAVTTWGRVHHARHVSVGEGGRATGTTVVWRERDRVGLLRLPGGRALDFARLADALLRVRPPADRWGRVLAGIRPDGSVPLKTALEGFVVAYGPLPGVHAPGGRRTRVPDGTGVLAWMRRYGSRLTPPQRRVVAARLGLHLTDRWAPYDDRSFRPDDTLTRLINEFVPQYEKLTHHRLGVPIVAGHSDRHRKTPRGDAAADAVPSKNGDGTPVCRVRILPEMGDAGTTFLLFTLAHEAFHCFQFDLAPDKWWSDGAWIIEGGAEWASAAVYPNPDATQWIEAYIRTPRTPLFGRDYDGAGFWGHAADMTTPETVFADMGKILNARTNIDAYGIAGGFGTQFLTDWGTSVFRQTTFTPEWTMRSPATPPDFLALPPGDLGAISGHGEVSAPAYATSQYVVHTHADVVHVAIAGHAEIYSNGLEYSDLGDAYFCTREECSCPPGSTGDLPPLRPLFDQDYLGVTGDPGKGASGSIESMSLSDFCHPAPKPPPAVPEGGGLDCRSACGSSNGDPHLQTIAGRDYDFQARGEFTAVKSTTDDLEIQERQEPFKSPDVTVNSAVAMSVAGDRVEVDRGLVLRVNGTAGAPGALPHGGTVASEQGVITVTWPDGSQARLSTIGPWGVVYLFEPAPARAGQLVGLLGDSPQLVGRDGHVYARPYGRFGDSWRIAQAGSLFTYAPGKSTASYTDRRTPRPVKLPARTRAAAAAACASITNPLIRRDCVLDVGVTGERAFATAGAQLQRTAQAPPAAPAFEIVCDSAVPPDASGQVPVGTDVGIEVRLHGDGQVLIHWPQDGIVDQGDSDTSDFHELDDPGIHTAYATSGGAQSETCTWNVSG